MEQNLSSPLPIAAIAKRLHLSTRNLQRLFLKHLGHAPLMEYRQLRLKHAHWMLRAQIPVIAAAVETGFANASQFSAAYQRLYGHAPSEARHLPSSAGPRPLLQLGHWRRPTRYQKNQPSMNTAEPFSRSARFAQQQDHIQVTDLQSREPRFPRQAE